MCFVDNVLCILCTCSHMHIAQSIVLYLWDASTKRAENLFLDLIPKCRLYCFFFFFFIVQLQMMEKTSDIEMPVGPISVRIATNCMFFFRKWQNHSVFQLKTRHFLFISRARQVQSTANANIAIEKESWMQ